MLEAYSLNVTVPATSAVPFDNVTVKKGCTAVLNGVSTIELNKCGVYEVICNASSTASVTLQLYKDGVAQADAISVGNSPTIATLVTVTEDNTCCACTLPTTIQVKNTGTASATLTNTNIVVTKIC